MKIIAILIKIRYYTAKKVKKYTGGDYEKNLNQITGIEPGEKTMCRRADHVESKFRVLIKALGRGQPYAPARNGE